jgi:hypothetical protein
MLLEFDTFLARLSLSIYPALGLIGPKYMPGPIFLLSRIPLYVVHVYTMYSITVYEHTM